MSDRTLAILALLGLTLVGTTSAATLEFTLLTWDDTQATPVLLSAVGQKPSQSSQPCDWLLFTTDDYTYSGGWNPSGAISHNFADPAGDGGSEFVMAPSLTCALPFTLDFAAVAVDSWNVTITVQAYTGYSTSFAQMNQFLISAGDPATQDSQYAVDGLPNQGTWTATPASNWSLTYTLDFYLATNTDGNDDPLDIDAAFNDCAQVGYLIPVSELTETGLADMELDDPAEFYDGDFKAYVLNEIAPRLPIEATALLITQMDKQHPVFTDIDVSITTNSLIGNTTFAYTVDPLPCAYDIDGDGDVDLADLQLLLAAYGTSMGDPGYNADADFDRDGDVDLADLQFLLSSYGHGT